jgi:hypothetical protein
MALNRIPCPECGAALNSAKGFTIGQTVCCPKCETYFKVAEPAEENEVGENERPKAAAAKAAGGKKPIKAAAVSDVDEAEDDEEEFRPKKKKKRSKKRRDEDDDDERSYTNSPLRFVILGVLLIVLVVLGVMLYLKFKKENANETADANSTATSGAANQGGGGPGGGPKRPPPPPVLPGANQAGAPGFGRPTGKKEGGGPIGIPAGKLGLPNLGLPDVFGAGPLSPEEKTKLTQKFSAQLVGTWKADLGDGVTAQLIYTADGKVTETVTTSQGTKTTTGTWTASGVANRKTLLVTLTWSGVAGANKPVQLVFEDDELQHPVLGPGAIGIFRK